MSPIPDSSDKQLTIAIVGLGYVGLSLAVQFGRKFPTLGLDLSIDKVSAYRRYLDPAGEISTQDLQDAVWLQCHNSPKVLKEANFIIELSEVKYLLLYSENIPSLRLINLIFFFLEKK